MSYITEAELRIAPYKISESDADKETIGIYLDITKDIIDKLTRQELGFLKTGTPESPVSFIHDGNGKRGMALNRRLVTLVSISKILSDTSLQTFEATDFIVNVSKYFVEWKELVSVTSSRIRSDIFDKGVGNIDIKGVWGWETVPSMIKYLQGRLIELKVRTGSFTAVNQSENLGDYSFQSIKEDDSITGVVELDMIIKKYRRFRFNGAI